MKQGLCHRVECLPWERLDADWVSGTLNKDLLGSLGKGSPSWDGSESAAGGSGLNRSQLQLEDWGINKPEPWTKALSSLLHTGNPGVRIQPSSLERGDTSIPNGIPGELTPAPLDIRHATCSIWKLHLQRHRRAVHTYYLSEFSAEPTSSFKIQELFCGFSLSLGSIRQFLDPGKIS